MVGAVRVMLPPIGLVLLDGRKMVVKALSCANLNEPTVRTGVEDVSQVSLPEQRSHVKARQKAAWNILWLCRD